MAVAEKINQRVRQLPESVQAEVLSFVERLLMKAEREQTHRDRQGWSGLSLSLAMRGMEDEAPEYTEGDLVERFS